GLGKTFIAGEVMQIYRERRQRALLICPAALRDSTWRKFLARFQLFVECLSYGQLASDRQLRNAQRPRAIQQHLQRPLDEYQLVVVDEAHNYRNPDAPTRAGVLRRLLFGQRRDLLLLTATPVNNSLWDLYHLIRFFVRQDAHFVSNHIVSIRGQFEEAMREDPSSLSPDLLYPIIDATTVKRTRQFVKKHYSGDNIIGPDGRPQPIVFPQPRAISVRYNLDDLLPGFFDRLEAALELEGGDAITFTRYMPDAHRCDAVDSEEEARAHAMVRLLGSGLLKRFASSAFAFHRTVSKMAAETTGSSKRSMLVMSLRPNS
ncbi:MAG: SNF2-related protein, partial [Gammaproteobacteria bacterium]|nr:SNF2-related protein [Gammaproteobacteria bacterium]